MKCLTWIKLRNKSLQIQRMLDILWHYWLGFIKKSQYYGKGGRDPNKQMQCMNFDFTYMWKAQFKKLFFWHLRIFEYGIDIRWCGIAYFLVLENLGVV